MDYSFVGGVAVAVAGIVLGNLLLNGIKGNKKASEEAFKLFVEETRANFRIINKRLEHIENAIRR
uniref:Uncharacterized protein n=1 Tax=Caldisericum exile TaxID=693075 RepID=A0A7C4U360_9BACT